MTPMQQAVSRVSRLTKRPKPHLMWSSAQDRWTIGNYAPSEPVDCLRATRFIDSRPMPYNIRDTGAGEYSSEGRNYRTCGECGGSGRRWGTLGKVSFSCYYCSGTGKRPEAPNGIPLQPYVELPKD